jgi:hypothetical protein
MTDCYTKDLESDNIKLRDALEYNRKLSDIWVPKWIYKINEKKRKNKEYLAYVCLADGREIVKVFAERGKFTAEKIDGNYVVPICHKKTIQECVEFVEEYYKNLEYPYSSSYREEEIHFYEPTENICL